ncbi:MAG: Xaa-Pro peptidase family protein, partial [Actinomycetota bacterium]|nr:Xaa-Pro peptidase family protein [Actinomycetota bacterium]
MNSRRIENLLEKMDEKNIEALLVSKIENVRYLSGFSGTSAFLVLGPEKPILITDGRYAEQARKEVESFELVIYEKNLTDALSEILSNHKTTHFEGSIQYELYQGIKEKLKGNTTFEVAHNLVEEARAIKDPQELEMLKKALKISKNAFLEVLPRIKEGASEREIASLIEFQMRSAGAEAPSFESLVASGANSSMPHAKSSEKTLEKGESVILDFGAKYSGYNSDITRTLLLDADKKKQKTVEDVQGALQKALKCVGAGMKACELDSIARTYLKEKGLDENFLHGLGHGVGLEVHEKPVISKSSTDILAAGMVFTIEPGVYFEGNFGVRIEEMVYLSPNGGQV